MYNSILFKAKENMTGDQYRLVGIFFKDWVDQICEQQVQYTERDKTFRADFEKQEDALALRLRGLPPEFRDYLKIVE